MPYSGGNGMRLIFSTTERVLPKSALSDHLLEMREEQKNKTAKRLCAEKVRGTGESEEESGRQERE